MDNKKILAIAMASVMVLSGAIGLFLAVPSTEAKVLNDSGTVDLSAGGAYSVNETELAKLGLGEESWKNDGTLLILNDVNYETTQAVAIRISATSAISFTIELQGDNSLKGKEIAIDCGEFVSLTVTGSGKLTATSTSVEADGVSFSAGIYALNEITFDGCKVICESGEATTKDASIEPVSAGIYSKTAVNSLNGAIVMAYGNTVNIAIDMNEGTHGLSAGVAVVNADPQVENTIIVKSTKGNESYLYGFAYGVTSNQSTDDVEVVSTGVFSSSGIYMEYGVLHGYGGEATTNGTGLAKSAGVWCGYTIKVKSDVSEMVSEITAKGNTATSAGKALSCGIYVFVGEHASFAYRIEYSAIYAYAGVANGKDTDSYSIGFFIDSPNDDRAVTFIASRSVVEFHGDHSTGYSVGMGIYDQNKQRKHGSTDFQNCELYITTDKSMGANAQAFYLSGLGFTNTPKLMSYMDVDGVWHELDFGKSFHILMENDSKSIYVAYKKVIYMIPYGNPENGDENYSPIFVERVEWDVAVYILLPCTYHSLDGSHFKCWIIDGKEYESFAPVAMGGRLNVIAYAVWDNEVPPVADNTQAAVAAIVAAVGVACGATGVALIGFLHKP